METKPTVQAARRRLAAALASWLRRPVPAGVTVLCVLALLTLPAWQLRDQLRYNWLTGDDFAYIADSRDASRLRLNLFVPHNTHIVPLFRLWTFALIEAAGRLSRLPTAFAFGSYATFGLALLALGHLVTRATRSQAAGLAAMAVMGLSTLNTTVILWFSAGQALCAGTLIIMMLIALESWRRRPGAWKLGAAALCLVSAAMLWTGGLLAGPAGAIFLWTDGRSSSRRAAIALLAGSVCLAGLLVVSVSRQMEDVSQTEGHRRSALGKAYEAARSTSLAIPEALVLRNLGIDANLTGAQGLVICLALACCWSLSRRGAPSPLEAAGAVIVVGSYLMVFYFRGYMPYEDMRVVGWYHAIPDLGAILFAAGWWAQRQDPGRYASAPPRPLTGGGLTILLAIACGMLLLHRPAVERQVRERAPAMTAEEASMFRIPELQRLRALGHAEQEAARQRRMLSRLEGAERAAQDLGIGRITVRRTFGRVLVPGIPELQRQSDAASLLALPDENTRNIAAARVREALGPYMVPEPEFHPPWLNEHPLRPPAGDGQRTMPRG